MKRKLQEFSLIAVEYGIDYSARLLHEWKPYSAQKLFKSNQIKWSSTPHNVPWFASCNNIGKQHAAAGAAVVWALSQPPKHP